MMKRWGQHEVSSALEVATTLRAAGHDASTFERALEPPTWGGREARHAANELAEAGASLWSWDDYGIAYSTPEDPTNVHYRPWHILFHATAMLDRRDESDRGRSPRPAS